MPVPIFEQPRAVAAVEDNDQDDKISGMAVFFSIILVLLLIVTIELGLRDLNAKFNDEAAACKSKRSFVTLMQSTKSVGGGCDLQAYEFSRVVVHGLVSAPIVVISMMLFLLFGRGDPGPIRRVIRLTIFMLASWLMLHLLVEGEYYIVKHHPVIGKYVVLLTVVGFFAVLVVIIQRKASKKAA